MTNVEKFQREWQLLAFKEPRTTNSLHDGRCLHLMLHKSSKGSFGIYLIYMCILMCHMCTHVYFCIHLGKKHWRVWCRAPAWYHVFPTGPGPWAAAGGCVWFSVLLSKSVGPQLEGGCRIYWWSFFVMGLHKRIPFSSLVDNCAQSVILLSPGFINKFPSE